MKSLKLGAVALAATVGLSACSTGVPAGQAKMDNKLDSISYAIGMTQFPAQMKSGIEQQLGEDVMADVIKGVKDGYKSTSKKEKAYALGVNIGQAIDDIAKGVNQNVFGDEEANKINKANILAALLDALQGNEPKIEDIQSILTEENFNTLKEEYSETAYADLKKENEDFLAENAKKEGVVVTESGLQYKIIESGDGEAIQADHKIKLSYEGKLIDGTVFDSNEEVEFPGTKGLVAGFTEALELMKVGDKWEIFIPQELGYGTNPHPASEIKPYSALIFTVEILGVESNDK